MATVKNPSSAEMERLLPIRHTMLLKIALSEKLDFSGNVFWEEITCVGYNPQTVTLEAVVAIKQVSGYSGGLCSAGSKEFVRFFVNYGAGFEDLGYTSFDVHDIPDLGGPLHPIEYMVRLPLPDSGHRRCCGTAVIPTVRAVLSWNTPPLSDPNVLNTFGNRLDAHIQLAPTPFSLHCLIESGVLQKEAGILKELDLQQPLQKVKNAPATSFAEIAPKYREAKVPDHRLLAPSLYAIMGKSPLSARPFPSQTLKTSRNSISM